MMVKNARRCAVEKARFSSMSSDDYRLVSSDEFSSSASNSPVKNDCAPGRSSISPLYGDEKLKFSVENILRPDFGCKAHSDTEKELMRICAFNENLFHLSSTISNQRHKSNPTIVKQSHLQMHNLPPILWPSWVYCTRYSDRPSAGPRTRRTKRKGNGNEKRPRTAFTSQQLEKLRCEFQENRYLTEKRRQEMANELGLNESQIKIWFQNKRAKLKKQARCASGMHIQMMAEKVYKSTNCSSRSQLFSESNTESNDMSDLEIEM